MNSIISTNLYTYVIMCKRNDDQTETFFKRIGFEWIRSFIVNLYIYIHTFLHTFTLYRYSIKTITKRIYTYIYMYVICIFVFNPIFQLILIGSLLQNFSIPLEISNIITLADVLASFS